MAGMRDKHIWIFNGGNDFSGNPKWLFMYIVNHRKDIQPYWLCYNKRNLQYVRKLGFHAYLYKSKEGRRIMERAGVYVVNQVKEVLQPELDGITILNLWHGVGCKTVERKVTSGFLQARIIKKYIQNYAKYRNQQLFLVTSPLMEKHFIGQCGLEEDQLVRGGYPCCMHKDDVKTFDHDILKQKGLPADTKIAVYAPTYRDASPNTFFEKAIPDMEQLVQKLQENHMLLIFKMHPLMGGDRHYQQVKQLYENHPNLLFWDNANDIYEIFPQIELAIIDYSSIFYDMLAGGVKHFIRYMFDLDEPHNLRDFVFDVKEMTCGRMADSFDQLLDALDHYQEDDSQQRKRIHDLFWAYEKEDSMEEMIQRALDFEPRQEELPTLYSFDIFDTVIRRKGGMPISIFYKVQEKLIASGLDFPVYLQRNFVQARRFAEANVREYYRKLQDVQPVERLEITFAEIYDHLAERYHLTAEQRDFLLRTEAQAELDDCIPYPEQIDLIKSLLAQKQDVILVSDMYLPKELIHQMLVKADPVLGELPLYLSSDCGMQKTTCKLFFHVFNDLDYHYGKWIHYGDSPLADMRRPRSIGIETVNHKMLSFNEYETALAEGLQSYDGYCVAAMMARFRLEQPRSSAEIYTYEYAALYFVPYICWAIQDALARGIQCLYFISRDGFHLKRIADAVIAARGYPIRTKYIYGSRKAWRIPSFIEEIDDEFFSAFGQFGGCTDFSSLLSALGMDEATFDRVFPELGEVKTAKEITKKTMASLRQTFKNSPRYVQMVMDRADEERPIVLDYLRQEINFDEKFAFVEYWGRGYTQDCLTRLLCAAAGREVEDPFYYMRSIYPTNGLSVRYNFTTTRASLLFVEALFANLPYRSITEYRREGDKIVPVLRDCENDPVLHEAFSQFLPRFASDFCQLALVSEPAAQLELFDFSVRYYQETPTDPCIVENLGHLKDSVELYGRVREFAPPITLGAIMERARGHWFHTRSLPISLARSRRLYGSIYLLYHNHLRHHTLVKRLVRLRNKLRRR